MPRQVIITTAALTVIAGAFGFWLGLRWEPLDETQVISRVIDFHVAQTGGAASDCVAIPGNGEVWLLVQCGAVSYSVDSLGRLMAPMGPQT